MLFRSDREWKNLGELGEAVAWTAKFNRIMDAHDRGKIVLSDEEIEHFKGLIQEYENKEELKLSLKSDFQSAIEKGWGRDYELFQQQLTEAELRQEKIVEEFLQKTDKYDEIINKSDTKSDTKPKKKGFFRW